MDDHERDYNPQAAVPDFAKYGAARAPWNARVRDSLMRQDSVPYGPHPLCTLDIFPAGPGAPVHVFFHGGYWRAQDKANFSFVAEPLVGRGVTAVIANYPLCPGVTLDAVAEAALDAAAFVGRAFPGPISLSGHSAGAHLVAEIIAADWPARGIDPGRFTGAVMVSGIFDPSPAMHTTVDAQLRLTPEMCARRNLEQRAPLLRCPAWVFAGGREPWRWIDQGFRYAHHLRRAGLDPAVQVLPGLDHFGIVDQFGRADSPVGAALIEAAGFRAAGLQAAGL